MKWVTLSKFSRTSEVWPFGLTSAKSARNPPPALFTRTSTRSSAPATVSRNAAT